MGKYLIAVATSDGVHVDTPFGEAERFEVYEITKDAYCKLEERTVVQHDEGVLKDGQDEDLRSQANDTEHCGCDAGGHSCEGSNDRVECVTDCTFVVCSKIGFHMQKLLAKHAVTAFDVECTIDEALHKIGCYLARQRKAW